MVESSVLASAGSPIRIPQKRVVERIAVSALGATLSTISFVRATAHASPSELGLVTFSTRGPELQIGKSGENWLVIDVALRFIVTSVSHQPLVASLWLSASNGKRHARDDIWTHSVEVISAVTFHDELLVALRQRGGVRDEMVTVERVVI